MHINFALYQFLKLLVTFALFFNMASGEKQIVGLRQAAPQAENGPRGDWNAA